MIAAGARGSSYTGRRVSSGSAEPDRARDARAPDRCRRVSPASALLGGGSAGSGVRRGARRIIDQLVVHPAGRVAVDPRLQLRPRRVRVERRGPDAAHGGTHSRRTAACCWIARGEPPPYRARRSFVRRVGHAHFRGPVPERCRGARARRSRASRGLGNAGAQGAGANRSRREAVPQGGVAARFGAARLVSALVAMGALRPSGPRGLAERSSAAAGCRARTKAARAAAGSCRRRRADRFGGSGRREVLRCARQPDRLIPTSAAETLDAGARRLRRPAARHHLIHRSRRHRLRQQEALARLSTAAGTSSPRTAATGFPLDQPQIVIEAIREVLAETVRREPIAGGRVGPLACSSGFSGAACSAVRGPGEWSGELLRRGFPEGAGQRSDRLAVQADDSADDVVARRELADWHDAGRAAAGRRLPSPR